MQIVFGSALWSIICYTNKTVLGATWATEVKFFHELFSFSPVTHMNVSLTGMHMSVSHISNTPLSSLPTHGAWFLSVRPSALAPTVLAVVAVSREQDCCDSGVLSWSMSRLLNTHSVRYSTTTVSALRAGARPMSCHGTVVKHMSQL